MGSGFSRALVGRLAHSAKSGMAPFVLLLASCMRVFFCFVYPRLHSFLGSYCGCSFFSALCSGHWLDTSRPLLFAWPTTWTNSGALRYPFVGHYLMHFLDWGIFCGFIPAFSFLHERRMEGFAWSHEPPFHSRRLPQSLMRLVGAFLSSQDLLITFAFLAIVIGFLMRCVWLLGFLPHYGGMCVFPFKIFPFVVAEFYHGLQRGQKKSNLGEGDLQEFCIAIIDEGFAHLLLVLFLPFCGLVWHGCRFLRLLSPF